MIRSVNSGTTVLYTYYVPGGLWLEQQQKTKNTSIYICLCLDDRSVNSSTQISQ